MKVLTNKSVLTRMAGVILRGLATRLAEGEWELEDEDAPLAEDTELVVDDDLARRLSEGFGP